MLSGVVNDARMILSPLLASAGFRHGFFTRVGGVSQAPFDALNFSVNVGDDPAAVAQNLLLAAQDLSVLPEHVFFLSQVHGVQSLTVDARDQAGDVRARQGDIVLSNDPDAACAVRVADCVPILLGDRRSGAVAAVHAGWRGTAQNVVGAAIRALRELGPRDVELLAAVGPHIGACCFEVGDDVAATLRDASSDHDVVKQGPRGRPHVSLRRIVHAQLLDAGVSPECIDHVRGCTMCDPQRFYSYRRDGWRCGRHLCAIAARAPGH
jgi:polyphenol oxidase